ncbi:hypothetical protein, conserved [Eimeria praecox]|uniref:Uncharacterized protein n=1 Tax=Eimeria praecox TaxID=51316 RepID=U6H1X3_9EIME|nr:hypothetical protein, conserved [Eimeria praecox]
MDSHSHPLLGGVLGVLPSLGSIEGLVRDLELKTTLDCDDRTACVQRSLRSESSYAFSCRLRVTFVSLAVVYLLVRCLDLTRGRSWVTLLRRSLAAGGDRPCQVDTPPGADGEAGEEEDVWKGRLEGYGGDISTGQGLHRLSLWQARATLRPSAMAATAAPGSLGGIHLFASTVGLGAAASELELRASQPKGAYPADHPEYAFQELPEPESGGLVGLQPKEAVEGYRDEARTGMVPGTKLRMGETLHMWERRSLPPYAEQQVVDLFHRMIGAASVCRSMLRILTQSQRLHLAREVVRLLALELGAFSLVQERLEPLRSKLGSVLLQLSNAALQRSGQEERLEEHRRNVRNLVTLVAQLTRPRPASEGNFPSLYRVKMLSLLRTATEVVGFCENVLEGLAKFEANNNCRPPSELILQQLRVLKQLYEVHSSYIARDSTLRRFIIECQKSIGMQPILCHRHAGIAANGLPSMRHLVEEIHQAVRDAGGLIQSGSHATRKHDTVVPTRSASGQPTPASQEPMSEERRQIQQPAGFVSSFQPPPVSAGMELQNLQTVAVRGRLSHPPVAHVRAGHRLAPTIPIQPPYAPGNAHRRVEHVPSQLSQSVLLTSTHSMDSLERGVQDTLLYHAQRTFLREKLSGSEQNRTDTRGDASAATLPYSAVWQEAGPLPQPYSQQPRPILVGPYAHAGAPRYPSQSAYSMSDHGDRPPLLQPATRRTVQTPSWGYRTLEGDSPQQEEEEEVEEVAGLLGELIKGGLKLEDIFPSRKRSDA